jgi:hypothetical protein
MLEKKPPERVSAPDNQQLSESELEQAKEFVDFLTRAMTAFLAFEYADEKWAEIERSLRYLQPGEKDLGKARRRLGDAARSYRLQRLNAPGEKTRQRWFARDWARIFNLSEELMRLLHRRSKLEEGPPDPNGGPPLDPWRDHKKTLMNLNVDARGRMAAVGTIDGFPRARPRVWFQFRVLELWTHLGGKLQFSRRPNTHKISGPLARYFSAATQPVVGGSLESLPDIVKRHKAMALALSKRRVSQLMEHLDGSGRSGTPPSFAEVMAAAAEMGGEDWAKQGDVQALLKEALADWKD